MGFLCIQTRAHWPASKTSSRSNMGLLDGKVGFVTGAARGQGRSHALRLAQEGAAVIAVDVADAVPPDNTYPPATQADFDETARQLRAGGHRFLTARADV